MENYLPKTADEFIELFFRRKRLFLIPFASIVIAFVVAFPFLPRIYTARSYIIVEEGKIIHPLVAGLAVTTNISKKIKVMTTHLLNDPNLVRVAEENGLINDQTGRGERRRILRRMKKKTEFVLNPETQDLIEVKYSDRDPKIAQTVANGMAQAMIHINQEKKLAEARSAIEFIEKQLHIYKEKLEDSEGSFFRSKVKQQLEAAIKRRAILKYEMSDVSQTVTKEVIRQQNPVVAKMQNELTEAEVQLNKLMITAKPGHPLVQELKSKIETLRARLKLESSSGISSEISQANPLYQETAKEIKTLDIEINELQRKLLDLKDGQLARQDVSDQELLAMERDKKVNEDIYKSLLLRLENAHISERLGGRGGSEDLSIMSLAPLPTKPSFPDPLVMTGVGIFFAILAGCLAVFGREYLDSSFRGIRDVRKYLELPFLGYVQKVPDTPPVKNFKESTSNGKSNGHQINNGVMPGFVDPKIVTYHFPESAPSEQFRLLRTTLLSLRQKRPLNTILITSAREGEGKTTTAVNLAVSMSSELNQKTLLVDADLRRGTVAKKLGKKSQKGLSDYLMGQIDIDVAIQRLNDLDLSVIMAGTPVPNPTKLFGYDKLADLMRQLRSKFDLIIFDSPPILNLADVPILTDHVDGVLFVIQSGKTRREQFQSALSTLEQTRKSNILGYVLTQVENHLPEYINPYLPTEY